MAEKTTLEVKGLDALAARLKGLGVAVGPAAGNALRVEAELMMTEAKRRTPVLTGALRASGHVTGPEGDAQVVTLAFGGPAAPYAVFVHENLAARHVTGEAKFLERPVLEALPGLPERIAARIRKTWGA